MLVDSRKTSVMVQRSVDAAVALPSFPPDVTWLSIAERRGDQFVSLRVGTPGPDSAENIGIRMLGDSVCIETDIALADLQTRGGRRVRSSS